MKYTLYFSALIILSLTLSCEGPIDETETLAVETEESLSAKDKRNVPKNTGNPDPGPSEYDIAVLDLWHLRPFTLAGRDYEPYDIPGHTNVQGGEYYIYRPDPEYITPWVEYVRFNRVFADQYTTSYHQDTHVYNGGTLALEDVGDFYYLEQKIDHINNDYWIWYNNTPRDPDYCIYPFSYDDGSGPGDDGIDEHSYHSLATIRIYNDSAAVVDYQLYLMAESCDGRGSGEILFHQRGAKPDTYILETTVGVDLLQEKFPPLPYTNSRGEEILSWVKNVKVKIKVNATRNNPGAPVASRAELIIPAADIYNAVNSQNVLYFNVQGSVFNLRIEEGIGGA